MRLDAMDNITDQKEDTGVRGVESTDGEKEDSDNEIAGCGGTVPPP